MNRQLILNPKRDILKVFHDVYRSKHTYIIQQGGRSSGKSTEIAEELVDDFMSNPYGNVVCFRKLQNSLQGSVYTEIKKALERKGLKEDVDFECRTSPLRIRDISNGTGFYFFGMDNVNKIKSQKIEYGVPFRYWFEEFQENDKLEDLDKIEDVVVTFIRELLPKGMYHQVRYSLNRPRNPNHLVNVWLDKVIEEDDEDYLVHTSTYDDVRDNRTGKTLLSPEILKKIELTKKNDYDTYRFRYLGEAAGENKTIYNMENIIVTDELPDNEHIMYYDLFSDTGYQVSSSVFMAWGITNKNNLVLIDLDYYAPDKSILKRYPTKLHPYIRLPINNVKFAPSDLSRILFEFLSKTTKNTKLQWNKIYGDSADGAIRTQFYRDYGLKMIGVKKYDKEEMVEKSRTVMSERTVYVLDKPQNHIFLFEMGKYEIDKNAYEKGEFKVVKIDDHSPDAFQYCCITNYKTLGLK